MSHDGGEAMKAHTNSSSPHHVWLIHTTGGTMEYCTTKSDGKCGFGSLGVACCLLSTQVRGFKPGRSRQDFSGRKNPQHAFLRKGSKAVGPMSQIAAHKRFLNWRGSHNFRQNYRPILAHTVPPFATRISRVVGDVGLPGGKHGNVQTGGGDRVSTISLLHCNTSVALATGPTDEEEGVRFFVCWEYGIWGSHGSE